MVYDTSGYPILLLYVVPAYLTLILIKLQITGAL